MKKYVPVLSRTKLFVGVSDDEIVAMLSCLGARTRSYKKGVYVLRQGERLNDIAVLLDGNLHVQKDDYWGNRSILGHIAEGDIFDESHVSPEGGTLLNDVVAVEDSVVVFFDVKRVVTTCSSACPFHSLVVRNLLFAISDNNRKLARKLDHLSKRSTREKLISYLSEEAKKQNSSSFAIPFNRQQLADFLLVDRSAMSRELGKMRDDGLLEFDKERFTLLGAGSR